MAYTLQEFCQDSRTILAADTPLQTRIDAVAQKLSHLLREPTFVAETFNADTPPGRRTLYHDADLDFHVLAHAYESGLRGSPHSHGNSWAIYGNATDFTRMREFRRVNPESEEGWVLEQTAEYDMRAGDTKAYTPNEIHSTEHPQQCWVVRVTGTDLEVIPRYRFRKLRDQVLEKT